jgi:putative lipase involved disintegration of autophagic bodies
MTLNTGLANVGFHYGVDEEVTPQSEVREPWQVRDVLKWGFETDTIRPTCGLICGIASVVAIAVKSTSLIGRWIYAAGFLSRQRLQG